MTKRRAEDTLLCDVPLKRCIRSLCRFDAQLPGMAVVCGSSITHSPSLPDLPENCRKRTYNFDEQEVTGPRKKSSTNNIHCVVETHVQGNNSGSFTAKNSGSFQENKAFPLSPVTLHQSISKKRMRDEDIGSQDKLLVSEKGTPTEDELCTFNTFQFWRVPLPDLDLSLLQNDDPAAQLSQPPTKDSVMVLEMDAMET